MARQGHETDEESRSRPAAEEFGGFLRTLRLRASLSQEELADRAQMSARNIRRLERDPAAKPFPHSARALADALGLVGPERKRFLDAAELSHVPTERADLPDPAAAGGLPRPAGAFVGRADDLRRVLALADDAAGHPVVTLVGPGGVGKTRLAIETSARAIHDRPVAFVPLERLTDPDDVLPAVARALGVPEAGRGAVAEAVAAAIGGRPLLLALDNFEHLLDAAPVVTDLIARCPGLTVLATSREALRVSGEQVVPLAPLAVGATGPAVELFLDRARRANAAFEDHAEGREAVAALCAKVDGLPLAIEIAAAQMDTLTPAVLLALLDQAGIGVLETGRRDGPQRFASMEAAIAWGYDRLEPEARACLRALGVFAGGGPLDAVAEVAATLEGGPDDAARTARALSALTRTHLARVQSPEPGDAQPRYALLEPVRLFALDRLRAVREETRARHAHAAAVGRRARAAWEGSFGPEPGVVLNRLERDHDNVRAAFDWAFAARHADVLRDLVPGAGMLWYYHGHLDEGQRRLDALLSLGGAVSTETLGYASGWAGLIAGDRGQPDVVLFHADLLDRAAAAIGSPLGAAVGLLLRSQVLGADPATRAEAIALAEQARALVPEIVTSVGPEGGPVYEAWAHGRVGVEQRRSGDLDAARANFEASLAIRRRIRNPWGLTVALGHLGFALLQLGFPRGGAEHLLEGLDFAVAMRDAVRGHQLAVLLREAALLGENPEALRLAALLDGAVAASAERHARPVAPPRDDRLAGLADAVAIGRGCALADLPGLVADLPSLLPERTDRRPDPLPEAFTVLE